MTVVGINSEIGQIAETGLEDDHTETNPSLNRTSGEEISKEDTEEM